VRHEKEKGVAFPSVRGVLGEKKGRKKGKDLRKGQGRKKGGFKKRRALY